MKNQGLKSHIKIGHGVNPTINRCGCRSLIKYKFIEFKTEINYEGIIGRFGVEDGRCGEDIVAVKTHND